MVYTSLIKGLRFDFWFILKLCIQHQSIYFIFWFYNMIVYSAPTFFFFLNSHVSKKHVPRKHMFFPIFAILFLLKERVLHYISQWFTMIQSLLWQGYKIIDVWKVLLINIDFITSLTLSGLPATFNILFE